MGKSNNDWLRAQLVPNAAGDCGLSRLFSRFGSDLFLELL
jgi:hypothetical protein